MWIHQFLRLFAPIFTLIKKGSWQIPSFPSRKHRDRLKAVAPCRELTDTRTSDWTSLSLSYRSGDFTRSVNYGLLLSFSYHIILFLLGIVPDLEKTTGVDLDQSRFSPSLISRVWVVSGYAATGSLSKESTKRWYLLYKSEEWYILRPSRWPRHHSLCQLVLYLWTDPCLRPHTDCPLFWIYMVFLGLHESFCQTWVFFRLCPKCLLLLASRLYQHIETYQIDNKFPSCFPT